MSIKDNLIVRACYYWLILLLLGVMPLFHISVFAAQSDEVLQQLIQQARRVGQQIEHEDKQRLQQFQQQYQTQKVQLQQLEQQLVELKQQLAQAEQRYINSNQELLQKKNELQQQRKKYQPLFNEIRHFSRELISQIQQSHFYTLTQSWITPVMHLVSQDTVITEQQVRELWVAYLEWIKLSGALQYQQAAVILPNGEEQQRAVTYVGNFSLFSERDWLSYLPESQRLMLITPQPVVRGLSTTLLQQNSQGEINVLIDPQHGKLIKQLAERTTWWDELKAGGIVGAIIILLGALALVVVIRRFIVLKWLHNSQIQYNEREQTELFPQLKGLSNALIEGHLSERLQMRTQGLNKGLSFIATVATVTPLLGLLGTVIGMIDTFQALMLHGNEDPSTLSGGISQALVTTELGLVVAIPLVLLQGQLRASVKRIKAMDEQFYMQLYVSLLKEQE